MMKKYCFNMIEIILAISIIAIGLSSVMALFVSGIKVGNDTVASSNIPDVSESLLNHIRAKVDECRKEDGWDAVKLGKIVSGTGSANWSDKFAESSDGRVIIGDDNGRFLYRQLSVSKLDESGKPSMYTPTFTAVASVRELKETGRFNNIVLSDPAAPQAVFGQTAQLKDADGKSGNDLLDRFRVVLQVTISYPADAPADAQTAKVYIMECFNDKYDRFAEEGEEQTNAAP